jgi:hypothetical protein
MPINQVPYFIHTLYARPIILGADALYQVREEFGRGVHHGNLAHQLSNALLDRLHLVTTLQKQEAKSVSTIP